LVLPTFQKAADARLMKLQFFTSPSMKSSIILTLLLAASLHAQTPAPAVKPAPAPKRAPTVANVPYGSHERQVLDFYKADSPKPTPLLFFIHGGGWVAGDKSGVGELEACLKAGISVVSINYRYSWQAQLAGVMPPVQWPLEDAARALQFVRSRAQEWNIDKQRIGASGGSAGACSSLYLAFHDDMADPKSRDPIARESTRLWCAAVSGAQTSLDPKQLKEWTPNSRYGGHAFGFMDPNERKTRDTRFAEFLEKRESVLKWIKMYSPYELVSKDDPPVYLYYSSAPAIGQEQKDPTHTSNYGVKLQEHCREIGDECELVYPGAPDVKHKSIAEFLIDTLKK
jgi:acetyl esterase/lipase